jgi:hypothetical protein
MLGFVENEIWWNLGAFEKLKKKSTVSFILSPVYPSVLINPFGHHWKDFNSIRYWNIFRKSVKKIYVSLKSDK